MEETLALMLMSSRTLELEENGTFVIRKCKMRRADRHKRSVYAARSVFQDIPDVSVRPLQPPKELRSLRAARRHPAVVTPGIRPRVCAPSADNNISVKSDISRGTTFYYGRRRGVAVRTLLRRHCWTDSERRCISPSLPTKYQRLSVRRSTKPPVNVVRKRPDASAGFRHRLATLATPNYSKSLHFWTFSCILLSRKHGGEVAVAE